MTSDLGRGEETAMFGLKAISREAVPNALAKAGRDTTLYKIRQWFGR